MDLPFSFPCPKCGVKLKIKDERLLGRSMKCPKFGR